MSDKSKTNDERISELELRMRTVVIAFEKFVVEVMTLPVLWRLHFLMSSFFMGITHTHIHTMSDNSNSKTNDERIAALELKMRTVVIALEKFVVEVMVLKEAFGMITGGTCNNENCESCKQQQTTNDGEAKSTSEKKQDVNKETAAS